MTKWMSAFLVLFFTTYAFAAVIDQQHKYYPEAFYDQLDHGLRDEELKKALFQILSQAHSPRENGHDTLGCSAGSGGCYQHTPVGYKQARKIIFGEIHLEPQTGGGYGLFDVYCQVMMTGNDIGPGKIPNNNVINVEHTWPQSKFGGRFGKDMQKSDLHHLYPTASHANSTRGNFPFSNVELVKQTPCTGAVLGRTQGGEGTYFFEPPLPQKGNVARAIFYFAVRYQLPVSATEEASLKAWHDQDPVDDRERERNDKIFAKQKDRNPFIDHPELVGLIADY